jgi:hypothetical protein
LIASSTQEPVFFAPGFSLHDAEEAGFRTNTGGVHTSRTMMLAELTETLASVPATADKAAHLAAIVEENCTHKSTAATRRLTALRLAELYALDAKTPIFRALRKAWEVSSPGRPLLAMLCALARDIRFLKTAPVIIALNQGAEFQREPMVKALRTSDSDRLNASTLDKVVRNTASSWSQSGHLVGRTFKMRHRVNATPAAASFAAYIASHAGLRGVEIFRSGWFQIIDTSPTVARSLLLEAKQLGLIDLRIAGDVITLGFDRLDAAVGRG